MKSYWTIITLSLLLMSFAECKVSTKDDLSYEYSDTLDIDKLLNKKWSYSSSSNGETSIAIDELGDLPKNIYYQRCEISPSAALKNVNSKMPFTICAEHDNRPFGNKSVMTIVNKFQVKGVEKIRIQHYTVSGDALGKSYYYYITKLTADSLIIMNERLYSFKNKQDKFAHIYINSTVAGNQK